MNQEQFIVDMFEDVAARTDEALFARTEDPFHVYFDYGHYAEIVQNLTNKGKAASLKDKKYPLIWLVMDFVEKRGEADKEYYASLPDLQILIVTATKATGSVRQRYETVFKPRLSVIYREFMYQIGLSGYFTASGIETIPHEKIDRPFWGLQDSNGNSTANLFNDHVDAIQIRKMRLEVNQQTC